MANAMRATTLRSVCAFCAAALSGNRGIGPVYWVENSDRTVTEAGLLSCADVRPRDARRGPRRDRGGADTLGRGYGLIRSGMPAPRSRNRNSLGINATCGRSFLGGSDAAR